VCAQLSAICFDKNERRLVTAGSDGSVFMWNFNNGSRLKEFTHSEEKEEITSVLFAADEKRESDAVYAAGWNCKVRRPTREGELLVDGTVCCVCQDCVQKPRNLEVFG